ncbi:hypothetical protein B0H14DRAFT_3727469 [Mycena olivaceomarginata]|nr:hypothetical protein B0H14DRAFT_3727469 [Mycena olivaceomarginata]
MSAPPAAPDVTLMSFRTNAHRRPPQYDALTACIMIVQAFLYYSRYKGDRPWFRYLVLYLVLAETANWVCDVGIVYEPLIIRYGTPEALQSPLLLRAGSDFDTRTALHRLAHPGGDPFVRPARFIALLAIISFGGGLATSLIVSLFPASEKITKFRTEIIIWLVSSTVCDVVLTVSLVASLWTRKTNMISTDSYVNKIIRLSIQTGFVTAAGALLDLILFLSVTNSTFNFMFDFPLSKLYTNALISTLNARPWQEHVSQHEAPNALFEQSNQGQSSFSGQGQTSFTLVQRGRTSNGFKILWVQTPDYGIGRLDYVEGLRSGLKLVNPRRVIVNDAEQPSNTKIADLRETFQNGTNWTVDQDLYSQLKALVTYCGRTLAALKRLGETIGGTLKNLTVSLRDNSAAIDPTILNPFTSLTYLD